MRAGYDWVSFVREAERHEAMARAASCERQARRAQQVAKQAASLGEEAVGDGQLAIAAVHIASAAAELAWAEAQETNAAEWRRYAESLSLSEES
jgi:hypothetical protein